MYYFCYIKFLLKILYSTVFPSSLSPSLSHFRLFPCLPTPYIHDLFFVYFISEFIIWLQHFPLPIHLPKPSHIPYPDLLQIHVSFSTNYYSICILICVLYDLQFYIHIFTYVLGVLYITYVIYYVSIFRHTHTYIFLDIAFSVFIMLAICIFHGCSVPNSHFLKSITVVLVQLMYVFILTPRDKCSLYFSSRKHSFARDRNDYRNPCSHVYVFRVYHLRFHNIWGSSFLENTDYSSNWFSANNSSSKGGGLWDLFPHVDMSIGTVMEVLFWKQWHFLSWT